MSEDPAKGHMVRPEDLLKEHLKKSPEVNEFIAWSTKFLADTEKPNYLTIEQFRQFIPLFNCDRKLLAEDNNYRREIMILQDRWDTKMGINHFFPTFVVASETDRTELYVIDRRFTRIKADITKVGQSARTLVPDKAPLGSGFTRDVLLVSASVNDIAEANHTPEQIAYFKKVRGESEIIAGNFIAKYMPPEKRKELYAQSKGETVVSKPIDTIEDIRIFRDDEDDDED
jgi:hypothetical protein